jgi:hypothetical protein
MSDHAPGGRRTCAGAGQTSASHEQGVDGYGNRVRVDGTLENEGASLVGTLLIEVEATRPEYDQRVTIRLRRQ